MAVIEKFSKTPDMPIGIQNLLTDITDLKDDEKLLIITDDNNLEVAMYVYKYASVYFDTTMCVMKPRAFHGENPTELVRAAMEKADVAMGMTTMSLFHSEARLTMQKKGLRWLSMQNYTMDMFTDSGLTADFKMVHEQVDRVGTKYFGKTYHLTSAGGTDLTASVEGREPVLDYGTSCTPGSACGTPSAEIALAPIEGTAEGVLVIDGSIPFPGINVIDEEPIVMKVEKGNIVDIKGGKKAAIIRDALAAYNDPTVYNIGELGLGLNPLCRLRGIMAEDEGSFGNMHVGIGKNLNFGGVVDSPIHLDMITKTVTITIDDKVIMENGVLKA